MAEKILETKIPRETGYLYFTKGNPIAIYKAKMVHGGKKGSGKLQKKKKKKVEDDGEE